MKLIDKPTLPKEVFSSEVNTDLLAQAVRVHLANRRQGTQSALTRAEIQRTRKKYQKQKGSGNARHGDRKAPIFVGGGVAFAPKPRDHSLSLSSKMRRAAIFSALSSKNEAKEILVASEMTKLSGKTAEVANFLVENIGTANKLLIVTDTYRDNVYRAGRNIPGISILPMDQINVYEILKADKVLIMEEALAFKEKVTTTKETKEETKVEEKTEKTSKKVAVKNTVTKKTTAKKAGAKSK